MIPRPAACAYSAASTYAAKLSWPARALRSNALYDRPDNYWETVADRYRGMTVQVLDETARRYINPGNFVWVVVGDAAVVRPQLARLGLPIEVVEPQ